MRLDTESFSFGTMYTHVLFDFDHTLFDSDESEREAYRLALSEAGVDDPASAFPAYQRINRSLWAALERSEITLDRLRVQRFEDLSLAIDADFDAAHVADRYSDLLGACGELYDGAADMLEILGERVSLGLVTNGVSVTQRARLRRCEIESMFEATVVSGEFGSAKPGLEIFDEALRLLGDPQRVAVLMVGDSMTSDIAGALKSGIGTCWFNPSRAPLPEDVVVDHEVCDFADVIDVVLSN